MSGKKGQKIGKQVSEEIKTKHFFFLISHSKICGFYINNNSFLLLKKKKKVYPSKIFRWNLI